MVKYFCKKAPVQMFDEWLRISRTADCIRSAKLSKCYMNSPHVTNKMPTTNGYRSQGKTKHFFKSRNLLSIRVPHKFHLFVSYDCFSYHRIEVDVMCSVQDINISGFKKWDKNGWRFFCRLHFRKQEYIFLAQSIKLISCMSSFLLQKVSVILVY